MLRTPGEAAAGALRGGEAVQPVLRGAAGQLVEQLVARAGAAAQHVAGGPPIRSASRSQWPQSWRAAA